MATEQADGSNYRVTDDPGTDVVDGSNYRDADAEEPAEIADGSNLRVGDEPGSETADGSNYRRDTASARRRHRLHLAPCVRSFQPQP